MVVCHLFPKQCFFANTFQKMWYLAILATKNKLNSKISWLFNFEPNIHLVCVWEARFAFPKSTFCISVAFFFFNFLSRNFWLFSWTVHGVHCSQTPKFYFSATFSLKMGLMVLFTHLKIILLQCFLFSAVSKRTLSTFIL